jgi:hypothetical protein
MSLRTLLIDHLNGLLINAWLVSAILLLISLPIRCILQVLLNLIPALLIELETSFHGTNMLIALHILCINTSIQSGKKSRLEQSLYLMLILFNYLLLLFVLFIYESLLVYHELIECSHALRLVREIIHYATLIAALAFHVLSWRLLS